MNRILRLLCLQSLTSGGIRANRYDAIRKTFAQTYGYSHIFTLGNLERTGLGHSSSLTCGSNPSSDLRWVRSSEAKGRCAGGHLGACVADFKKESEVSLLFFSSLLFSWMDVEYVLISWCQRLIDERVNTAAPDDISYVSAGQVMWSLPRPFLHPLHWVCQVMRLSWSAWCRLWSSAATRGLWRRPVASVASAPLQRVWWRPCGCCRARSSSCRRTSAKPKTLLRPSLGARPSFTFTPLPSPSHHLPSLSGQVSRLWSCRSRDRQQCGLLSFRG